MSKRIDLLGLALLAATILTGLAVTCGYFSQPAGAAIVKKPRLSIKIVYSSESVSGGGAVKLRATITNHSTEPSYSLELRVQRTFDRETFVGKNSPAKLRLPHGLLILQDHRSAAISRLNPGETATFGVSAALGHFQASAKFYCLRIIARPTAPGKYFPWARSNVVCSAIVSGPDWKK